MSVLAQIKSDQLQARKQKDVVRASLLTTLIGEAEMIGKNQNREVSDQEVQAMIKKFLKGIAETIEHLKKSQNAEAMMIVEAEREILMAYQPKQLSEAELRDAVTSIYAGLLGASEKADMGAIMKVLKSRFDGLYDAKLASSLIKEALV